MNRILVVDDDESYRREIVAALELDAYDVLDAADGEEGIHLARSWSPDLIICNETAGTVDGATIIRTCRHEPALTSVPIIFMAVAANSSPEFPLLYRTTTIRKPVRPSEIGLIVHSMLTDSGSGGSRDYTLPLNVPQKFRNPLNVALTLSEILNSEASFLNPGEIRDIARTIYESCSQLERLLVNQSLSSGLQANPVKQRNSVGASQSNLAETIAASIRLRASQYSRECDLRLFLADVAIDENPEHIVKIVDELIDNALKFSEPGTIVDAEMTAESRDLVFRISDHGPGISPGCVQTSMVSTGSGLAITKAMAGYYGGSLDFQYPPGAGTTAVVRLPNMVRFHKAVA